METLRNPNSLIQYKAILKAKKQAKEIEQKKQLKRIAITLIIVTLTIIICNILEIQ